MKIVIFAALVVASMGECPAAFADSMVTEGYAYGSTYVAAKCETPTGTPKYTAATNTAKKAADIGKPTADGAATGIVCAAGYSGTVKFGAADKDCALTGCTKDTVVEPKFCAADTKAKTDNHAAFERPKCEAGRSTKTTECTADKKIGSFYWTCKADGTWDAADKGGCVAASWQQDKSGCKLATKAAAITTPADAVVKCSSSKAEACGADSTKPTAEKCTKSAAGDDPKCLAATIKALNDASKSCSKEEDVAAGATVAGVGLYEGKTWTCTLSNNLAGDGVLASWVMTPAPAAALTCGETAPSGGGGGDGSSTGTLSTFVALVAAVAYMW